MSKHTLGIRLITAKEIMEYEYEPTVTASLSDGWLNIYTSGGMYKCKADPIKVLGFLHHMTGKLWFTRENVNDAINAIRMETDWDIHPF